MVPGDEDRGEGQGRGSEVAGAPRSLRVKAAAGALVLAIAALPFATRYIVRLYSDAAPFHQNYRDATTAQNQAVTTNLNASLIAVPMILAAVLALVLFALRGRVRRALPAVALVAAAAAAHALYIRLSLPYGFGSAYEHASAEQLWHMSLVRTCVWIWTVVAVGLVCATLATKKPIPARVAPSLSLPS